MDSRKHLHVVPPAHRVLRCALRVQPDAQVRNPMGLWSLS
jgi:hypothetical protein